MNSRRSHSDQLNTGQHTPGSDASLDHISRALDDLESHLGQILNRPVFAESSTAEEAPFRTSTNERQVPTGDFRQLIQEELAREFGTLRHDLTEAISTHPALAGTAELGVRLEEIAQALGNLPDSLSLRMLDERVRVLAMALNELLSGTMLGNPEQHAMIDERLDEISRAIASLSANAGAAKLNPEPFERIEARIASLARQMSELAIGRIDESAADRISTQMHSLCLRMDEIAQRIDMPELMAERLVEQAARLEEWLSTPEGGTTLTNMEARLDDISERLQTPQYHANHAADETVKRLEAQILNLSKQLAEPVHDERASEDISARDDAQRLHGAFATLEAATRKSDERNAKTFEAIHDTLLKIAERFDTVEQKPDKPASSDESQVQIPDRPSFLHGEEATETHAGEPDDMLSFAKAEQADKASRSEEILAVSTPEMDLGPAGASRDLNTLMRRLRGDGGGISKTDFIATARRAAQAAAAEVEITTKRTPADMPPRNAGGLGRFLKRASASAALLIGTGIVLYGGWQWGAELFADGQTEAQSIEKTARVAPENAPAKPIAGSVGKEKAAEARPPVRVLDEKIPKHTDQMPAGLAAVSHRSDDADDVVSTDPTVTSALPNEPLEMPEAIGPLALRDAAARNDARALFEIGDRYAQGRGVEADPGEARRWFERAAGLSFAPAQYRLGLLYWKGQGGARDAVKAREWFERAADQGNTLAMHNLGLMAATGVIGEPDHKVAARWFIEAAERGLKDSQFNLGTLSARGMGVTQDLEEAYKWFDLAARAGDADAATRRDKIAEALTPEQLTRARGKAILWKAKPSDHDANIIDLPEAWGGEKTTASSAVRKEAIANIQSILNRRGFDAGPPDGVLGERTRSAISAFQTANGMAPDGELDEVLMRTLLARSG